MRYNEIVDYLYGLQKFGTKFGLDNITKLCEILGNPHKSFLSIHIAGTNGKGSTSAIVESILRKAGLNTGLFTSPHLVSFTERIKVNGIEIPEEDVISLTEEIKEIASGLRDFYPTFFEVVTAMAFAYFHRKNIDVAVIEVGMGGRLDSTNIISPTVCIITPVSFDHKEFLGNTLKEIAFEKAGIIKNNVPIICSHQYADVLRVISERAEKLNSALFIYEKDFFSTLRKNEIYGVCFDYRDNFIEIENLSLPLSGNHQIENASVAIRASIEFFKSSNYQSYPDKKPLDINEIKDLIKNGLSSVKWHGRLEFVHYNPDVIIDGAHNPAAATILADNLKKVFLKKYKKIIMLLGIMNDKDIEGIMKPLLSVASDLILTAPSYNRAANPSKLLETASNIGFKNAYISETVDSAIKKAFSLYEENSLIVITGSFYTIGEASEIFGKKGVLTKLRECPQKI